MIRNLNETADTRKIKESHASDQDLKGKAAAGTTSSTQLSRLKDVRIVRVSRGFAGKDRHSKVCTVRGLRDRRVRLSVPTAIQLYDLQHRLGLSQPSKVVDWLLNAAKTDIDKLPPLPMIPGNSFNFCLDHSTAASAASAHAHNQLVSNIPILCKNIDLDQGPGSNGLLARLNSLTSNNQSQWRSNPLLYGDEKDVDWRSSDDPREERMESSDQCHGTSTQRGNHSSQFLGLLNGVPLGYQQQHHWEPAAAASSNLPLSQSRNLQGFSYQALDDHSSRSKDVGVVVASSSIMPSALSLSTGMPQPQTYIPSSHRVTSSMEIDSRNNIYVAEHAGVPMMSASAQAPHLSNLFSSALYHIP